MFKCLLGGEAMRKRNPFILCTAVVCCALAIGFSMQNETASALIYGPDSARATHSQTALISQSFQTEEDRRNARALAN